MPVKLKCILTFVLMLTYIVSYSQTNSEQNPKINKLKLFIEGDDVPLDLVITDIDFADIVNDPKSSDVHIIVIKEETGSGGYCYSVWFNSITIKNIKDFTLSVNTMSGETTYNIRELIKHSIIRGLMPFLNEVENVSQYELTINKVENENADLSAINDKWNFWVFKLRATGGFDYEENIRGYNYSGTLYADKVTENFKLNNYVYIDNRVTNYLTSDYIYYFNYKYAYSKAVFSISDHWSAGITVFGYQSTPINTKFAISTLPAIEYNLFPWEESNKHILTLTYAAGYEYKAYNQITRFNKMNDHLAVHKLYLSAGIIQPWGEITVNVSGTEYLHDLSMYNVSFGSDFSIRISKGLSVTFDFLANNIHNQIYLSKESSSDADIITEAVKLPTNIELSGNIGITFQFGSIYNNIVNRRM